MSIFFNALSAVSVLLMLMGTGYFLGRMGWMEQREKKFLGTFIVNVAVPATCIVGLTGNLKWSQLRQYSILVLAAALSVVAVLILGISISRLPFLPQNRRGVLATMMGVSNTLFIGIPVATQIYGDEAIPYLMMYYLSNTIALQTVGMMLIRGDGQHQEGKISVPGLLLDLLKKPPVIGILISVVIIGLDISIPTPIWTYLQYIGGTVSPLALIYCGYVLFEMGLSRLRPMKWHGLMLAVRLVVAPMVTWVIVSALGITGLPRGVFTLVSALPVVSQVPVFAGAFGADEEYAAVGASLSVILCCVSIPILMVIIG